MIPQTSSIPVYTASHINGGCRVRATKAQMADRRRTLFDIVKVGQPMSVRQVFYQASIRGVVDKDESGYAKVQVALVKMRRDGELPYKWIADNTRWMMKPRSYADMTEALEDTARLYRKALWRNAGKYVEFWIEKDALAGTIYPITSAYDVPLMVARGYSSVTFLNSSAEFIIAQGVPAYIYHLGDSDPSGVNAAQVIERTLREMAPNATIHFERLAVLPEQIAEWSLPTRPTKQTDTRAKGFGASSVELDAIEPDRLRKLVQDAIVQHLPDDEFAKMLTAEASEREALTMFARAVSEDDE